MKIIQNKSLKDFTTIGIEGKCKIFIEINSINDFTKAIKYCEKYDLIYRVIGSGSSIYFSDYFDGAILYNKFKYLNKVETKLLKNNYNEDILILSSGITIKELIKYYIKNFKITDIIQQNLDILSNINGTIGGAIYNNTNNICSLLEGCTILKDNNFKFYSINDFYYNFYGSNLKLNTEKNSVLIILFLNLSKQINTTIFESNNLEIKENIFFIKNVFNNIYLEDRVILIKELLKDINFNKINNEKIEIIDNVIFNKNNITSLEFKKFINNIKLLFMNIYGFNLNINIECI